MWTCKTGSKDDGCLSVRSKTLAERVTHPEPRCGAGEGKGSQKWDVEQWRRWPDESAFLVAV